MAKFGVCIVLHAHLPYVRHLDRPDRLEEGWLFEALTESYIPLLMQLEAWEAKAQAVKLTLSVTPPLLAMLADPLLKERYHEYLVRLMASCERELLRTATNEPAMHPLAQRYAERFRTIFCWYEQHGGDVVAEVAGWARRGRLQLWTSAATHAFLPFMTSDAAIQSQIELGVASFQRVFDRRPDGFWLPECGYRPGLERWLGQWRLGYTVVNPTAHDLPESGIFRPFRLGAGVTALPRATELSMQVWDAHGGYPGSPWYRDFYRDIGFDLDDKTVAPYLYPAGVRRATGFKYWRVTGATAEKRLYQPDLAEAEVIRHAEDFAHKVDQALTAAEAAGIDEPVLTLPFDAELFGHWWAEGVDWLGAVLPQLPLRYPSDLDTARIKDVVPAPALSSWGRGGFGEVWCNPKNDWVYPELARARAVYAEVARVSDPSSAHHDILNQALRELLLAESSDWPFILDAESSVDYAKERLKTHGDRFSRLIQMATNDLAVDADWIQAVSREDAIFPDLDWRRYRFPDHEAAVDSSVLMLSWEYPPHVMGGLGQHVYDLSRYLVQRGTPVTVLTVARSGSSAPAREWMAGVEVVRVPIKEPSGENFWDWILAMNLAMYQAAQTICQPRVMHAHDWLVADAALALQATNRRPLVVTIHATERGRQGGIHSRLQEQIDDQERRLTESANRVIVCSRSMRREIVRQWKTPSPKILVLPNGVDPARVDPGDGKPRGYSEGHRWLLYFGRLVPEKGIDVLLAALPQVLRSYPDAKLAVLGSGPYLEQLQVQASELAIANAVRFLGFARQHQRNLWLSYTEMAIFPSRYEPFGIAALEAMAAGVPVIAAKVGGMADVIVHDKNGILVPPDHAEALARAIIRLLAQPTWAERLANQALSDVRHYSWDQIARRTEHTYRRLIKAGQP